MRYRVINYVSSSVGTIRPFIRIIIIGDISPSQRHMVIKSHDMRETLGEF